MNDDVLQHVIDCQQALLTALDARDPSRIEQATERLAAAVATAKGVDVWRPTPARREQVEHALKQSDAARIRVNILTDWTRQRIERLAQLRGEQPAQTYARPRNAGNSGAADKLAR